jgi:hypothetical protein
LFSPLIALLICFNWFPDARILAIPLLLGKLLSFAVPNAWMTHTCVLPSQAKEVKGKAQSCYPRRRPTDDAIEKQHPSATSQHEQKK